MSARTFCIDIGGSGIKGMVLDEDAKPVNERVRVKTPDKATPGAILATIKEMATQQPPFDRVSVGFPGIVESGFTRSAPNLDGDWSNVPLASAISELLARPCRAVNDADMQGYGAIAGRGVEMVLTLGTGMGAAIFTNGHLVPNLELGHHPFEDGETYEERVGNKARKAIGNKKWSRRVLRVIDQVMPIWNPTVLYIGGGNTKKLSVELPAGVRRVDNIVGILGGVRLWLDEEH